MIGRSHFLLNGKYAFLNCLRLGKAPSNVSYLTRSVIKHFFFVSLFPLTANKLTERRILHQMSINHNIFFAFMISLF